MSYKYLDKTGLNRVWTKLKSKLNTKQDTLVSGTNIKTINNISLLGNGNIDISGGTDIEELTSPIRIWDLDDGLYKLPRNCVVYYYGATDTNGFFNIWSTSYLYITTYSSPTTNTSKGFQIIHNNSANNFICYGYSTSTRGTYNNFNLNRSVIDNLTSTSTTDALSANQGKILNEKIVSITDGTNIDSFSDVETALENKQDTLVSGTNIKTINNTSLLGNGNIDINEVYVGDEQDAPSSTELLIDTEDDSWNNIGTEVVDTLEGNEANRAPSVRAVKEDLNTYSTEEVRIGTWMGKPLYRKTLNFSVSHTASNNQTKSYTLSHNISNVDKIFINRGNSYSSGGQYSLDNIYYNGESKSIAIFTRASINDTNITYNIYRNSDYTDDLIITILYTKTTD